MKLYEIDHAIDELIRNAIDPETGELTDISEEMESLQIAQDEKRENIALYIKNLSAEAEAIRNEEKTLAERRRAAENHAERLKAYLMSSLNGEKFSTPRVSVSFRNSTAVYIENEVEFLRMNPQYARIKTEIDKASLKDALKKGEVPGAALETRTSMVVR